MVQSRLPSDRISSLVYTLHTSYAILDLHFSPNKPEVLAVATSIGRICLFRLTINALDFQSLEEVSIVKLAEPSILVLSLAWCPPDIMLAASLSDGNVSIIDCKISGNERITESGHHDLEAWTVAWAPEACRRDRLLLSGGDDSAILVHNINTHPDSRDLSGSIYESLVHRDQKTHGAGVTAILPLAPTAASKDQIVITGSYDEFVRVLTLPRSSSSSRWGLLAEKPLGGGVWRLKLIKYLSSQGFDTFTVLASCMHAGARVLNISMSEEIGWTIQVSSRFEEHDSINYASDARPESGESTSQDFSVVSTSFYDRKLCLWRFRKD